MTESKAKPKANGTSKAKATPRATKPLASAAKSKSAPTSSVKAGGKRPNTKAAGAAPAPAGKNRSKPVTSQPATAKPAARLSDQRTRDLGDWRTATLARMRTLILEADPAMIEERKWRKPSNAMVGIPVWSHHGIVCTGETYAKVVKLTFARGASIGDPSRLFNSSLAGNTRRAIDIHEGEQVDAKKFKALIQAAVAENLRSSATKRSKP